MSANATSKHPPLAGKLLKGALYRKLATAKAVRVNTSRRLSVFTVVWVDRFGVPFNTNGFFAVAYTRSGRRVATAFFDNFGVAQFAGIPARTQIPLTLRTFNRNGVLYRTRRVPAGVEAFAIIG